MEKKRGRPPKKAYAGTCLTHELLETVSAVYAEKQEIKATALALELPPHKVKKLLITHGDIHHPETDQIIEMQQRGMSISEIAVTAQKSCEKSAPNSEARERRKMAHMFYDLLHGKRKSICGYSSTFRKMNITASIPSPF